MKRIHTTINFGLGMIFSLALASGKSLAQGEIFQSAFRIPHSAIETSAFRIPHSAIETSAFRIPHSAILVDRLVAIVNGDPITESDLLWLLTLDVEVANGRFSNDQKESALAQFIDQQLLYQEAQKLPSIEVSQDEVGKYITELIGQFPSESDFRRRLSAVGLDETTLQNIVKRRLTMLHFIDFRFRSFVFVSDQEIQSYYQSRIVKLALERGEKPPELEAKLRSVIESTITQDKVDSELNVWFDEARRRSEIVPLVKY